MKPLVSRTLCRLEPPGSPFEEVWLDLHEFKARFVLKSSKNVNSLSGGLAQGTLIAGFETCGTPMCFPMKSEREHEIDQLFSLKQ